jgi:hypothetical protein
MAGLVTDPLLGRVTDPDPDAVAGGCEDLLAEADPARRAARVAFARDRYDHRRVAAAVAGVLEAAARGRRG